MADGGYAGQGRKAVRLQSLDLVVQVMQQQWGGATTYSPPTHTHLGPSTKLNSPPTEHCHRHNSSTQYTGGSSRVRGIFKAR